MCLGGVHRSGQLGRVRPGFREGNFLFLVGMIPQTFSRYLVITRSIASIDVVQAVTICQIGHVQTTDDFN